MENKIQKDCQYVDLNLPSGTLWANKNVGANTPEEYGDYLNFSEACEYSIPKKWQLEELIEECEWQWKDNGYLVVGSNNNSIFLPAAGFRDGSSLNYGGSYVYYWSRTLSTSNTDYAYDLYFNSSSIYTSVSSRYYGRSVRTILNSKH